MAEGIIEIARGVLEEDAEGFALGLADEGRIDVAATKIDEAADAAEDTPEIVWPFPSGGEAANAAAAGSADAVEFGVFADRVLFLHFRNDFFDEETDVVVAEAIVFEAAVAAFPGVLARLGGIVAGVDEDGDERWDFASGDEVIQHGGHAPGSLAALVIMAVLEDHEASSAVVLVLGGNIDPPVAFGVWKNSTLEHGHLDDLAFRHAGFGAGIRMAGGLAFKFGLLFGFGLGRRLEDPFQCFWQQRPTGSAIVTAAGHFKVMLIARPSQRDVEVGIGKRPHAVEVIQIVLPLLHPDADGLRLFAAGPNESGVVVAAANIGETPDVGNDVAKEIGAFPCGGEGGDAAAADAASRPACGIGAEVGFLADVRQNFVSEVADEISAGGIVFVAARAASLRAGELGGNVAGIDEQRDGGRDFASGNKVV